MAPQDLFVEAVNVFSWINTTYERYKKILQIKNFNSLMEEVLIMYIQNIVLCFL